VTARTGWSKRPTGIGEKTPGPAEAALDDRHPSQRSAALGIGAAEAAKRSVAPALETGDIAIGDAQETLEIQGSPREHSWRAQELAHPMRSGSVSGRRSGDDPDFVLSCRRAAPDHRPVEG
jgi:hypothetical protein